MKNKFDPRHQQRIRLFQALFAWNLTGQKDPQIDPIIPKIKAIDRSLSQAAPKWPLTEINQVDLAILRLALWELKNKPETPPKVIIDEAIEIGKEYGNTHSGAFVNAVLGHILKEKHES